MVAAEAAEAAGVKEGQHGHVKNTAGCAVNVKVNFGQSFVNEVEVAASNDEHCKAIPVSGISYALWYVESALCVSPLVFSFHFTYVVVT